LDDVLIAWLEGAVATAPSSEAITGLSCDFVNSVVTWLSSGFHRPLYHACTDAIGVLRNMNLLWMMMMMMGSQLLLPTPAYYCYYYYYYYYYYYFVIIFVVHMIGLQNTEHATTNRTYLL